MTERRLYFRKPSADAMVRAVLAGEKTHHRQPIIPQPETYEGPSGLEFQLPGWYGSLYAEQFARNWSPFGRPGDHLWVRECFARGGGINGLPIVYRADSGVPYGGAFPDEKWTPSIHMPRDACRIVLVVKRASVERLQDITEADAVAEGFRRREHFIQAWDSIYAAKGYGFGENPYVWACEFERIPKEETGAEPSISMFRKKVKHETAP